MLNLIDFYNLKFLLFSSELITRTKVRVFIANTVLYDIQVVTTPHGSFKALAYSDISKNEGRMEIIRTNLLLKDYVF